VSSTFKDISIEPEPIATKKVLIDADE